MKLFSLGALRKIPFFVWLLLLQAFLLVNAPAIAPPNSVDTTRSALIVYMLMTATLMPLVPRQAWMKVGLNESIAFFVGGLVVGSFVFAAFRELVTGVFSLSLSGPLYLLVLHVFVVATSEEIIFRGLLPVIITPALAQVFFGFFHFYAYGGSLIGIFIAIIAGFIFYAITRYLNIWAAVGIHAAYNATVLGILSVMGV